MRVQRPLVAQPAEPAAVRGAAGRDPGDTGVGVAGGPMAAEGGGGGGVGRAHGTGRFAHRASWYRIVASSARPTTPARTRLPAGELPVPRVRRVTGRHLGRDNTPAGSAGERPHRISARRRTADRAAKRKRDGRWAHRAFPVRDRWFGIAGLPAAEAHEGHEGLPLAEGTWDPDNTNNLLVAPFPDALRIPSRLRVLRVLRALPPAGKPAISTPASTPPPPAHPARTRT